MRSVTARVCLAAAACGVAAIAASVATADRGGAPAQLAATSVAPPAERATAPGAGFAELGDDLGATLGAWSRDAHTLVDRIAARGVVLERRAQHALARLDRWVNAMAGVVLADQTLPDVSPLTTEPVKGIASSGFGWRDDPINNHRKFHKGADYRADRGTPVFAAGDGVVVFAGRQDGYGKVIYLDHGGGLITRYAHLRTIGVEEGEAVPGDVQIGEVGSTGRTTGPHLHFEVRVDGRAIDPDLALEVAAVQRSGDAASARLAALALLPEVQHRSLDKHDRRNQRDRRNRPERAGRAQRSRHSS